MTVGIKVDFLWYPIGTSDFLHSFFSTIAMNVEDRKWGSRFPVVMKNMYSGELKVDELNEAKIELEEIEKELKSFPPSRMVWDAEDITKNPPWGNNISPSIKNLADYFITTDGRNLINVMYEAINEAINEKLPMVITTL